MRYFSVTLLKWDFKSPKIKLLILLSLLMTLGLPYYLSLFESYLPDRLQILFNQAFEFPIIYNTITNTLYYFNYLFGVVIILMVAGRFENNTNKLALINGLNRTQLWLGSLYLIIAFSLLVVLAALLLSFSIGIVKDAENFTLKNSYWIPLYFLQSIIVFSYAVTFAMVLKHSGTATLLYLLWFGFIERIIAQTLDFNFGMFPLFRFLPGKVVEDLNRLIAGSDIFIHHAGYYDQRFTASLAWLAASLMLNYLLYKRADYVK